MQINQMVDLWGASKYGSCSECAKGITANEDAVKITFSSGVSIMLCEKCRKKLAHVLDEIDFNDVLKTLKKQENANE